MKEKYAIGICIFLLVSCKTANQNDTLTSNVAIASKFIDAFYSFNRDSLQSTLSSARKSQPEILYYQKWAECANYKTVDRTHYFNKSDSVVIFPVTVKDDLMGALAIDFNVTDTFHISIQDGKIVSVKTSSNDTDEYYEAKKWVNKNRRELVEKPCEGIWEGGPTPCECVLGMIKGFVEFTKSKEHSTL
ncbi:MAG TPA: hypothetical protein VK666_26065 [Chryseolinea sp.]|nr:hypothetical protein [Chryseolinea sp.]